MDIRPEHTVGHETAHTTETESTNTTGPVPVVLSQPLSRGGYASVIGALFASLLTIVLVSL